MPEVRGSTRLFGPPREGVSGAAGRLDLAGLQRSDVNLRALKRRELQHRHVEPPADLAQWRDVILWKSDLVAGDERGRIGHAGLQLRSAPVGRVALGAVVLVEGARGARRKL